MLKTRFPWTSRIALADASWGTVSNAVFVVVWRWWITVLLGIHFISTSIPLCSAQIPNQQNITIPLDPADSEVVYTPFYCNATVVEADPESCAGAWQSGLSDGGLPMVMSAGQNPATGNILPQIFFRFRASQAYLNMDPTSTSTINVTVSANNITIMNSIRASLGTASIVNMPVEAITTLTLTLLPAPANPVPFRLFSVVITAPLNVDSTSIFPAPTLPSPTPISTWFTQTTTSFATSTITMPSQTRPSPNRKRMIAQAVGITVGLGLGLTAIAVGAFFYWKKRRRIGRMWRRDESRVDFD